MIACGKGFTSADGSTSPALQAFLSQQVDALSCSALPSSLRLVEPNAMQRFSWYLLAAAAIVWEVTGISWRHIDVLAAGFFGVTMAAAYATLRFACGRFLSMLVTILWATSTWHLRNLPHLRDYSKTPFFVLMLLAMAIAFVERKPGRLLVLGIVFGIVQGFGYGMRADVALNFIPFFIVLFFATPEGVFDNVRAKLTCAAAAM